MRSLCPLLVLLCATNWTVGAFAPVCPTTKSCTSLAAKASSLKPKFNKATDKWEKGPGDDGEYPYDAFGALLRHGPSPFISRVTNPSEYE
jgi:hypothetical protein